MVIQSKFTEESETKLEIGFRTIKTKLDEDYTDYREVIFCLPTKDDET